MLIANVESFIHTEETGVGGHVGTLEHLGKASKGSDDTLEHLEGGLCTVVETVCQAVGVAGHTHATHTAHAAAHTTIHAASIHSTSVHATHAAHAATVASHGAKPGVGA